MVHFVRFVAQGTNLSWFRALMLTIAVFFSAAADGLAQSPPSLAPDRPASFGEAGTPRPSNWDAAVITGVFVGNPPDKPRDNSFDHWFHTGHLGVVAGRYLTTNLKLEGEVSMTGEGRRDVQELVPVPGGGLQSIGSEEFWKVRAVSGAVAWQFLENQWVHPFVFAGASLDLDHTRVHTWAQSSYRGDPRVPGNVVPLVPERNEDLGTTERVRGLIGAGAKLYVAPRAFFRTDARIGIGAARSRHVALRVGFGVDF